MKDIKKLIGIRVRLLRKERGLSQEQLGFKAGLHYTYIGAIERGEKNWSIDTLEKVVRALGVNISELFDFGPSEQESTALKKTIKKRINNASPEVLKLISDVIKSIDLKKKKKT